MRFTKLWSWPVPLFLSLVGCARTVPSQSATGDAAPPPPSAAPGDAAIMLDAGEDAGIASDAGTPDGGVSTALTRRYDFERDTNDWTLDSAWTRAPFRGGNALLAAGGGAATLDTRSEVSAVRFDLRLETGASEVAVRLCSQASNGAPLEYRLSFAEGAVWLYGRGNGDGDMIDIARAYVAVPRRITHDVLIEIGGGSVDVSLNGVRLIGRDLGRDLPAFAPSTLVFQALGDSVVYLDNVVVSLGAEVAPHARAPRPPLSAAPGPDVAGFVGGSRVGPWVVDSDVVLSQGRYTVRGSIIVKGNARLRVESGAVLHLTGDPVGMLVSENARFEVAGGTVVSDPPFNIGVSQDASVSLANTRPSIHVLGLEGRATATITNSRLETAGGGQVMFEGDTSATITDSTISSVFLSVPPGAVFSATGLRSGTVFGDFDLQRDLRPTGIRYNLAMRRVKMVEDTIDGPTEKGWVIGANEGATISIRDSVLHKYLFGLGGTGSPFLLRGTRLNRATNLALLGHTLTNVTVTAQWGLSVVGTRQATAEDCDGLWIWLEDTAHLTMKRSSMNEFDTRRYYGAIVFDDARWVGAGEILDGNDFAISGTLRVVPSARQIPWAQSVVRRSYPVSAVRPDGRPIADAGLTLTRGSTTRSVATGPDGGTTIDLRFDDSDRTSAWTLTANGDPSALSLDAFSSTPAVRYVGAQFDPSSLYPFTWGIEAEGMPTGRYPGGSDEMLAEHRTAGEAIAATIQPLDTAGRRDDQAGRVVTLALGHSNAVIYFAALKSHIAQHANDVRPRFEIINAAQGGQQLPEISQLSGGVWDNARSLLARPGYSSAQVQVLLIHTTYHGCCNDTGAPPEPFPARMESMRDDLTKVLAHAAREFPNLKIAYVTADGFRQFRAFEPQVWREAFAFKWLVAAQMRHLPGFEFDGANRALPWVAWGPYIWEPWDVSYFTDGVHPSAKGEAAFVAKYWEHLRFDSTARPWFAR